MTGSDERIALSRPAFGVEEEQAAAACIRSGWVTSGPRVAEFEKEFARAVGCEDAVAVSSGTAALHLALWLLDLAPGDEVITPSLTWVSVPNLVAILGGKPVFCDVDPETLNIDLAQAEKLVTPRTRAIVPVHFGGRAVDMEALGAFAKRHGLEVIEDAAHAIGGMQDGRPIGSHSGLVAFSFHPNKNISTGEGGMLSGTDAAKLKKARLLRYHGLTRDTNFRQSSTTQLPHYNVVLPGVKYIMTDIAGSIGLCQLAKLDSLNARRAALAARYRDNLRSLSNRVWVPSDDEGAGNRHAWHIFTIRLKDEADLRDRVMRNLLDRGIGVGLHYLPVHKMDWIVDRGLSSDLPMTERIGRTILSLPLHPGLTDAQVDIVCDRLGQALAETA